MMFRAGAVLLVLTVTLSQSVFAQSCRLGVPGSGLHIAQCLIPYRSACIRAAIAACKARSTPAALKAQAEAARYAKPVHLFCYPDFDFKLDWKDRLVVPPASEIHIDLSHNSVEFHENSGEYGDWTFPPPERVVDGHETTQDADHGSVQFVERQGDMVRFGWTVVNFHQRRVTPRLFSLRRAVMLSVDDSQAGRIVDWCAETAAAALDRRDRMHRAGCRNIACAGE